MNNVIGRILLAVLLLAAAALSAAQARRLQRTAETYERFATLRFDSRAAEPEGTLASWLAAAGLSPAPNVATARATAEYWQGRYDGLLTSQDDLTRDPDPEVLLLAANAAYRASQRSAQPRQAQSQQLDVVLQAYASVLKAGPFLPDAAYNYEFVARVRDALARSRTAAPPDVVPANGRAGDLPAGPTIHGRPGGPPPGTKGEEFEILTPMEFGDRETQPEPTAGGKPLRKG